MSRRTTLTQLQFVKLYNWVGALPKQLSMTAEQIADKGSAELDLPAISRATIRKLLREHKIRFRQSTGKGPLAIVAQLEAILAYVEDEFGADLRTPDFTELLTRLQSKPKEPR